MLKPSYAFAARTLRQTAPFLAMALLLAGVSAAQTLATGDGRGTVAEPTFPAVCAQVQADLTISAGEPSSELNTATDTTNIQNALKNCAAGKAVELVVSGANDAFVIAPIYIPAGVTLLVDGGVTVFGSRNAADYQIAGSGATCGSTDGGTGCNPLITLGQSSVGGTSSTYYPATGVTGLMGYGVINGRGYDKLITISGNTVTVGSSSWWDNAVGGAEDSPILVSSYKAAGATLYKIALLNSPHFHVKIQGQAQATTANTKYETNFTAWGIKLLTPWTPHNTDGIDPTGVWNMTVANSVIGDGDDESAISGSSITQNFTYSNLLLPSGHGLSIGSITSSAVTNVLYTNVNFSGQAADGNEIALRIKSYAGSAGGLVSQVTYNNACIQNVKAAIELDPFYSAGGSGTAPQFGSAGAPIVYQNVYVLTPASYINLQGDSTYTANALLNNVYVNGSSLALAKIQSSDTAATPSDVNLTLNGSYYPAQWASLGGSNGVTESTNASSVGTAASAASSFPAVCANAFPALMGELYASTTTGGVTTNNVTPAVTAATPAAVTIPATVTLNAMVLPTNSEATYSSYTGAAAPTGSVNFYDGATLLGSSGLTANGTLASFAVINPTAGTHTYTAQYAGDANYAATTFGVATSGTEAQTLTVSVTAGPAAQLAFTTAPASSPVYGTSPGTIAVQVQDAAGDAVTSSTAAVTLMVTGGPNSYSASYSVNAVNGTATFSNVANPPGVGGYVYTATSGTLTSATANESVGAATLTVAAQAAQRVFDAVNPAFVYGISGYVNGDSSSVVSGTALLSTTALRNATAGMGYPVSVAQGTLSAANYNFMTLGSTLTVNGSAPQVIQFAALPNFASGASYQLTASASSGLAVTYSVSGPATVSGATLTVTGPGAVTVTASQAGNVDYAAATNVAQSFTAQ